MFNRSPTPVAAPPEPRQREHARCPIRVPEWANVDGRDLSEDQRREIATAVEIWKEVNGVFHDPVSFSGSSGDRLCTRQYVGVIETASVTLEIFPKLDSDIADTQCMSEGKSMTVMQNLLWLLEASNHLGIFDANTALLPEIPNSYLDAFALLLGRRLASELGQGIPHSYITLSDDLRAVRGRLNLSHQLTRNWNRMDRVACVWDEFTPDSKLNRLFKCCCRMLLRRVRDPVAVDAIGVCITLLDEVEDIDAASALSGFRFHRWNRSQERFRSCAEMAATLLRGVCYDLSAGDSNALVFLLDMNRLFEDFVHAVLEDFFAVTVAKQKHVGFLLQTSVGRLSQYADYFWPNCAGGEVVWIGDAKYKHLAKGRNNSLSFDLDSPVSGEEDVSSLAGRVLNPADIRQLTVYAELQRRKTTSNIPPKLMLLYPFVGSDSAIASRATAWNNSDVWLVPVRLTRQKSPAGALSQDLKDVLAAQ